jgi:hypothetical protein
VPRKWRARWRAFTFGSENQDITATEIYTATAGCAREKICQEAQNGDKLSNKSMG